MQNELATSDQELVKVAERMLTLPQVECPVTHHFAPGVYTREIFMPAGSFIIGHKHKTEHLNCILQGRARVMMNGVIHDYVAPCIFKSGAGVRKVLYIQEDCRWATVHPTHETDLDKLRAELIIPTELLTEPETMTEIEAMKSQLTGGAQ